MFVSIAFSLVEQGTGVANIYHLIISVIWIPAAFCATRKQQWCLSVFTDLTKWWTLHRNFTLSAANEKQFYYKSYLLRSSETLPKVCSTEVWPDCSFYHSNTVKTRRCIWRSQRRCRQEMSEEMYSIGPWLARSHPGTEVVWHVSEALCHQHSSDLSLCIWYRQHRSN